MMDRTIRILVLEHDQDDIALIQHELKKAGIVYTSEVVQTEEAYKNALAGFHPDIILSDYNLPAFDGQHAFRIKQQMLPQVPFIFVSGAIGEENSVELIKNGVTDYVLKDKLFTLPHKLNRALKESEEKEAKQLAETKLITSEKLLAEAQAIAMIGNWEINMQTGVHTWSDEMYNIFGLNKQEHFPPSRELFVAMVYEEDIPIITKAMEWSFATHGDASFNFRFMGKDGELRHGRSEWKFEFDSAGQPLRQYGIIRDITERKKAEQEILQKNEELRQLSTHLQNVREDERKRIAREIHDELGQHLTALKMDVGWVIHKLGNTASPAVNKLNEVLQLSDDIINTVRRISSELRPAIIDDLGLMAALEWKCNDFEEKTGVPCRFVSTVKERKFHGDFGINVYRILQETLTNVTRHAEARSVRVSVSENEKEMLMEVKDDGKGIPADRINNGKTLGILGMKERAKLLGGELTIENDMNQGTITKLTLPYQNEHTNSR
jgi:two-component system sensor histidine kinase UhpB